jgi:histidine kinase-like protein
MGYDEGAVEYAHRSWPAEPTALGPIRREVERWLAGVDVAGDAWADLVLAVYEAASNVVDHAYRVSAGPAASWRSPRPTPTVANPARARPAWRARHVGCGQGQRAGEVAGMSQSEIAIGGTGGREHGSGRSPARS